MLLASWLPLLCALSVVASQCDLSPRSGQMTGEITGIECTNSSMTNMTVIQCVLRCHLDDACRVAYQSCDNRACQCVMCEGIHAIDFTRLDKTFHLKGSTVDTDITIPPYRVWTIPGGGLSVGRVIRVNIVLASDLSKLILADSNSNIAMVTTFKIAINRITRNSRIESAFGTEESDVPYFNFIAGQEVELVYIVKVDKYVVYIDGSLFFSFGHRLSPLETVRQFEANGAGTMGKIKSIYIS